MTMLTAALAMTAMLSLGEAPQPSPIAYQLAQQAPAQPAQKKPAQKEPTQAKPAAAAPKPSAKPAAKAAPKPAAKAKAPAKPHPAKAKTAAKPGAKPAPKGAVVEKRIGEVTVVDAPEQPYLRLDGPWREKGYELRTWLTSYVYRDKDIRPPFHTLTVQVTHHDEQARNYGRALAEKDAALDIAVATRPNQQCIRNRDGSRLCFYTEAYTVTVPDDVLSAARAKGLNLNLAAEARAPLAVTVDAATVTAQIKAEEEVAKN